MRTLDEIGEVFNSEHSELSSDDVFQCDTACSKDEVRNLIDSRVCRRFVCFGSLRSAQNFMSAVQGGYEEAQVTIIYRLKKWSKFKSLRPVQAKIMVDQFKMSILALK